MAYTQESGDFILTLGSDQTEYRTDEPIKLWATIEYVGSDEEVTISHYAKSIYFTIAGVDNSVNLEAYRDLQMKITKLVRNSTQTVEYTPSVTYAPGDPNEQIYKHFVENGQLPAGTYTVGARALFDLLDDGNKIVGKYNIPLKEIEITVK